MYQIRNVSLNLLIIGFVSSSMQLLLMREIMNISGGYELITGTFLASWLIGSAAGAFLAKKIQFPDIKIVNLIFALSPVISLSLLIFLTRLFLNNGETPTFLFSLIYTSIVLLPFCLISGYIFVRLTLLAQRNDEFKPGRSFSIETIGGIIAGLVITSLTAGILNTYQLILFIVILHLSYVILKYYIKSRRYRIIFLMPLYILSAAILILHPDTFFRQMLLPGIQIIKSIDTPYGNISTGRYSGVQSVYYNQRLVSYQNDESDREENIHYAMIQHKKPETVLLISGGLKTHLPEILKYPVKEVVYIERDPELIKIEGNYQLPTGETKIIIENNDAYSYVGSSEKRFDVIILLLPPPSTLLLNRYYTTEFFRKIKDKLNYGGVFMCSPGPGSNYFNKESINLHSSIFNGLKDSFKNVEPIMGNKLYYISSDSYINISICRLITERGINNLYVNTDYLSDDLISMKSVEIKSLIDNKAKRNNLLHPVSTFQYLLFNISKEGTNKPAIIVLLSVLFISPIVLIRRKNMIMYFSAAALAGAEIIVLIIIQLTIGNIYHVTGLVIASLMAGLAAGAGFPQQNIFIKQLNIKAIILIVFYFIVGLFISKLILIKSYSLVIIVALTISFIPAFFTGQIFRSLSDNALNDNSIANVYSADLAGSALGFIIVTGLLLPLIGIELTVFFISALIFTGLAFGALANK